MYDYVCIHHIKIQHIPTTQQSYPTCFMVKSQLITGWWFDPPLKNMKASWDDDIPNVWKNQSHVPVITNQMIKWGW